MEFGTDVIYQVERETLRCYTSVLLRALDEDMDASRERCDSEDVGPLVAVSECGCAASNRRHHPVPTSSV